MKMYVVIKIKSTKWDLVPFFHISVTVCSCVFPFCWTLYSQYSFINRTLKSWNQLAAGLLASFPCKLNTFRKRVKNVVTSRGKVGGWVWIGEVMWDVVMWSEMTWFMWSHFVLKWSAVKLSYGEGLVDKSTMYIRMTLYWGHLDV
jgi:hypothetical protein